MASVKGKNKGEGNKIIVKESGRGLPTTSTTTPLPKVKPPKGTSSGGGGKKK